MISEPIEQDELPSDSAEPEGLLYHYTPPDGLLGILKDKCIWATHIRYLNDTSEGEIVSRIVWQELNSRLNSDALMKSFGLPPVERTTKVECNDEEVFSQGAAMSSWVTSQDVFITSFSEDGNLLSQWRAYSEVPGDAALVSREAIFAQREHIS